MAKASSRILHLRDKSQWWSAPLPASLKGSTVPLLPNHFDYHGRFPCEVQPASSTFHDEPNLAGNGHDGSMESLCFGQAGVQHVTDGGPAVGCGVAV